VHFSSASLLNLHTLAQPVHGPCTFQLSQSTNLAHFSSASPPTLHILPKQDHGLWKFHGLCTFQQSNPGTLTISAQPLHEPCTFQMLFPASQEVFLFFVFWKQTVNPPVMFFFYHSLQLGGFVTLFHSMGN